MNYYSILFISTLALLSLLFFHSVWINLKPFTSNVWRVACLFWRGIMTIRHSSFVIALILCAFALSSKAQLTSINMTLATNLPTVVTTGASSNSLTSWFQLQQDKGAAFDLAVWGTGASNVAYQATPSIDGTNKSTSTNWWFIGANAGPTTTNHITGNLTRDALGGYKYICITALTNQNAGTVTNGGLFKSQ